MTSSQQRLEVCQGPDCFGAGGGATLIELEELVQEHQADNHHHPVSVVRGGCSNFCSMGPNVHYNQQHYTKVKDIQSCGNVLSEKTVTTGSSTASVATKLLMRRAEQQRWRCLRQMARLKASRKTLTEDEIERCKVQLDECLDLEQNAARNEEELQTRANRRAERLKLSLERIIQENIELSDDSSENEESGETR